MAERLPERPIVAFLENVRNVSHTTFSIVAYVNLFWSTFRETALYIIGTTYVFGCSVIVSSLAGKVSHVVFQAMLKTGTAF